MKKILVLLIGLMLVMTVSVLAKPAGYNWKANVFVGTGMQWCMQKFDNEAWCTSYLGPYADDKLKMKWNAEWNRGNDKGWDNPPYDAWLDNQWNGMFSGGSGEVWHYKIKWVPDPENSEYPIWGQFETLMDHGTVKHVGHEWWGHVIPSGYGS